MPSIPHDAANQANIGGRDAIVTVNVQRRKRRNIYAEGAFVRDFFDQIRVHAVNALGDDDVIVGERNHVARQTLAEPEVEAGKLHWLALHQVKQITVQTLQVERFQRLEVILAIAVPGGKFAVYEIIVHTKG